MSPNSSASGSSGVQCVRVRVPGATLRPCDVIPTFSARSAVPLAGPPFSSTLHSSSRPHPLPGALHTDELPSPFTRPRGRLRSGLSIPVRCLWSLPYLTRFPTIPALQRNRLFTVTPSAPGVPTSACLFTSSSRLTASSGLSKDHLPLETRLTPPSRCEVFPYLWRDPESLEPEAVDKSTSLRGSETWPLALGAGPRGSLADKD